MKNINIMCVSVLTTLVVTGLGMQKSLAGDLARHTKHDTTEQIGAGQGTAKEFEMKHKVSSITSASK